MKIIKIFTILLVFTLIGCGTEKENNVRKSAMLIYMAANNNLNPDIRDNLTTIVNNFVPSEEKDIYVFIKGVRGDIEIPKLLKIVKKGDENKLITIKTYDSGLITSDVATLNLIMSDLSALPDVTTVDDIIMSSHGGSWLPLKKNPAIVRGFGDDSDDNSKVMDIDKMADVLEQYNLNSIIFDACFMCSIEVLYELRNSAKYILASPAEILSEGIDYTFSTKYFTQKITKETLSTIADATKLLYTRLSTEPSKFYYFSVLTVTECAHLDEFGQVAKNIVKYDESKVNQELSTKVVYDGDGKYSSDYKEYLYKLIEMYGNSADKTSLEAVWEKTFVHYAHTDKLMGKADYDLSNSHGVAGYIYKAERGEKVVNDYYKTLDWGILLGHK